MSAALVEGTPKELTLALSGAANLVVTNETYRLGAGPIHTIVLCNCEPSEESATCDACFAGIRGRHVLRYYEPTYYEYLPVEPE